MIVTKQELIKLEFFQTLLPMLIYKGTDEEKKIFFESLCNDGNSLLHELLGEIFADDGIEYEYNSHNYDVECLEVGGLHVVKINLPPINKKINDVKRVYLVSARVRDTGELAEHRFFSIKYDAETGKSYIQFSAPNREIYLGDELTEKEDDLNYELWRLARNFIAVMSKNVGEEKGETEDEK